MYTSVSFKTILIHKYNSSKTHSGTNFASKFCFMRKVKSVQSSCTFMFFIFLNFYVQTISEVYEW